MPRGGSSCITFSVDCSARARACPLSYKIADDAHPEDRDPGRTDIRRPAAAPNRFVHTDGKHIVAPGGQKLLLRGINL